MFLFSLLAFAVTSIFVAITTKENSLRETVLALFIFFTEYFVFFYYVFKWASHTTDIPSTFAYYWLAGLVVALTGITIRALQFPEQIFISNILKEKYTPEQLEEIKKSTKETLKALQQIKENKWYNYVGNSHQWWHICINSMQVLCSIAMIYYLRWRADHSC